MIIRELIEILKKDLENTPVVVLYGPRQVGKTTLVKEIAAQNPEQYLYLDLEAPSDINKIQDPELFFKHVSDKTIIIDEVQTLPDLFPVFRSLVDEDRRPGRFILLGSASPELLQRSAESLAGRVTYRELFPFLLSEIGIERQNELWQRGGFPKSFLAKDNEIADKWLQDFIFSYASRDLRLLGLSLKEKEVTRLLQMLAHQHGQLLNYSNLANSLGLSVPTITNAIYFLEEAMLIRTLSPWHFNVKKRLVKAPKVYIRDSGMLHHLLFLDNFEQLMGHPQSGNSWEGFVMQQIFGQLPYYFHPYFYRSQDGAEIDLVLVKGSNVVAAIEIKLSNSPKLSRGNTEAVKVLQPTHKFIITPDTDSYPIKEDWMVCNLNEFLAHYLKSLNEKKDKNK